MSAEVTTQLNRRDGFPSAGLGLSRPASGPAPPRKPLLNQNPEGSNVIYTPSAKSGGRETELMSVDAFVRDKSFAVSQLLRPS